MKNNPLLLLKVSYLFWYWFFTSNVSNNSSFVIGSLTENWFKDCLCTLLYSCQSLFWFFNTLQVFLIYFCSYFILSFSMFDNQMQWCCWLWDKTSLSHNIDTMFGLWFTGRVYKSNKWVLLEKHRINKLIMHLFLFFNSQVHYFHLYLKSFCINWAICCALFPFPPLYSLNYILKIML